MQIVHFLITFVISYFFFKSSIPFLKKVFPAEPSERGMHQYIKPTSGGILFLIIYSSFALYQNFLLPLLSIPIAIVGLIDDKYVLTYKTKILAQVLTVILIILFLKNFDTNFLFKDSAIFIYLFLTLFGVAIINFVNFMDGIDGLVCGCMIIILISINGTFHYLFPAIGALTAFLIFNWNPSKIFMGDTGSLFLGSYLATLIFDTATILEFFKIILLCSTLIIDPTISILRRLMNKQNIFRPHKMHLYQRLVQNGMSQSNVSLIYMSQTLMLGIIYNYSTLSVLISCVIVIFIFNLFLDKKFAIGFKTLI